MTITWNNNNTTTLPTRSTVLSSGPLGALDNPGNRGGWLRLASGTTKTVTQPTLNFRSQSSPDSPWGPCANTVSTIWKKIFFNWDISPAQFYCPSCASRNSLKGIFGMSILISVLFLQNRYTIWIVLKSLRALSNECILVETTKKIWNVIHHRHSICRWPLNCIILVQPAICHGCSISTAIYWSLLMMKMKQ